MTSRETFELFMRDYHPALSIKRTHGGSYESEIVAAFWKVWQWSRAEAFADVAHCAQIQGHDTVQQTKDILATLVRGDRGHV